MRAGALSRPLLSVSTFGIMLKRAPVFDEGVGGGEMEEDTRESQVDVSARSQRRWRRTAIAASAVALCMSAFVAMRDGWRFGGASGPGGMVMVMSESVVDEGGRGRGGEDGSMEAFKTWYRGASAVASFGSNTFRVKAPMNKANFLTRKDCRAVALLGVTYITNDCNFTCDKCLGDTFRNECNLYLEGYCKNCTDVSCPDNHWREDCGDNGRKVPKWPEVNDGHCSECGACPLGRYRRDCGGVDPGSCKRCVDCGDGRWREGCGWVHEGECRECHECPEGEWLQGCAGASGGQCQGCSLCAAGEYRRGCGGRASGECTPCDGGQCAAGSYLAGCGDWKAGACADCPVCERGTFLVGCEGLSAGECRICSACGADEAEQSQCGAGKDRVCVACAALPTCPDGQYRTGCGSGAQGQCVACEKAPDGHYLVGCGGVSPGELRECEGCSALPGANFRDGCGGFSAGSCRLCNDDCGPGEYQEIPGRFREGCEGTDAGSCAVCRQCGAEMFISGCQHLSQGECHACQQCGTDEFEAAPCGPRYDRECQPCADVPSCAPDNFRQGCGGGSKGICKPCTQAGEDEYTVNTCLQTVDAVLASCSLLTCPEGHFRRGCGHGLQGECVSATRAGADEYDIQVLTAFADREIGKCESLLCPYGHWRRGCGFGNEGQCVSCTVAGAGQYEVSACKQQADAVIDSCDTLAAACPAGHFQSGCGHGRAGTCVECAESCPVGSFRQGCGGLQGGACVACQSCEPGQFLQSCGGIGNAGVCRACASCPHGEYRSGCSGASEGECVPCTSCGALQYEQVACTAARDSTCAACELLPDCGENSFRLSCGSGSPGECRSCGNGPRGGCPVDTYLEGCHGRSEGACLACDPTRCATGTFLAGCGPGADPGHCEMCQTCPAGTYLAGCGAEHRGACLSCAALTCPPHSTRADCGGTSQGHCIPGWEPIPVPPVDLVWARGLLSDDGAAIVGEQGAECLSTGVREDGNFELPAKSFLRLANCREVIARGRLVLPMPGSWEVQFFVGFPSYKRRAPATPASYPLEDVGQPGSGDTLVVTINGEAQTFAADDMRNARGGAKLIFFRELRGTAALDYTFVFKSDNALEHLHIFAANGEAAYIGAAHERVVAEARAHLPGGTAHFGGSVINAIDGKRLIKGRSVKDGYGGRVPVPADFEPVVRLFFGNGEMDQLPILNGKFSGDVKAGGYACQVTVPGFYSFFDAECSLRDAGDLNKVIALSPLLNPGSTRIVLSWGREPRDLDMWLTMPGDKCVVMWNNKRCHGLAALDYDVTQGFGPETITIAGTERGRYYLVVEHFRGDREVDRARGVSPAVENSGAQVALYVGNNVHRFVVGEQGYLKDRFWVVLRFDTEADEIAACTPELCPIRHTGLIAA